MIITIDAGNTNIVAGWADQHTQHIVFTERTETSAEESASGFASWLTQIFRRHGADLKECSGAIISSVVPSVTPVLGQGLRLLGVSPVLTVSCHMDLGFEICTEYPEKTGADLLAGAAAAAADVSGSVIIADLGTATTLAVVDQNKRYLGHIIAPGVRICLDALVGRTAQLPRIDLVPPRNVIGRNTAESMKAGILTGHAAMIDGLIDRIIAETGEEPERIIATGGLAPVITPLCRRRILSDDDLLTRGLIILFNRNTRE